MIDQDSVPSTIEKAVQSIVERLTDNDKASILDSNASQHHFSVGRYIRNEWSLWSHDSPLKRDAAETYKIAHPDDISGLILDWVFALVKEEDFDPQQCCERFHNHWKAYNQTSLEAGNYKC